MPCSSLQLTMARTPCLARWVAPGTRACRAILSIGLQAALLPWAPRLQSRQGQISLGDELGLVPVLH